MKGRELREWRQDQFMSQSDLAGLLGVHYTTVANWEAGRANPGGMLELALEQITGQRQRQVAMLRQRQEKLAHQRRLKEIAQGLPERRAALKARQAEQATGVRLGQGLVHRPISASHASCGARLNQSFEWGVVMAGVAEDDVCGTCWPDLRP